MYNRPTRSHSMKKTALRSPDFKPTEEHVLIGLVESDMGQYLIAIYYSFVGLLFVAYLQAHDMKHARVIALQLAETYDYVSPRDEEREALRNYTILVAVTNKCYSKIRNNSFDD